MKYKCFFPRVAIVSIAVSIVLALCGCWNYREIDDIALATGMAIDKADGEYKITAELVVVSKEGQQDGEAFSVTAKSVFEGIRRLIEKVGKKVYWGHAKIIIVGNEVAKEGIAPLLDMVFRDAEVRVDMWVMISDGIPAEELLNNRPDKKHHQMSMLLEDIAKSGIESSRYQAFHLWRFIKALEREGISPIAPVLGYSDITTSKDVIIKGMGIFNGDKLIGTISEDEVVYLSLLRNEYENGELTIPVASPEGIVDVTLLIKNSDTKRRPGYTDNGIKMNVAIYIDADIKEIDGSYDWTSQDNMAAMEKQGERMIKECAMDMGKKAQDQFKSDCLLFSEDMRMYMPEYWIENHKDWEDIFQKIELDIEVNLKIKNASLRRNPITITP